MVYQWLNQLPLSVLYVPLSFSLRNFESFLSSWALKWALPFAMQRLELFKFKDRIERLYMICKKRL